MNFDNKRQIQILILSGIVISILDAIYLASTKDFYNRIVKKIQGNKINPRYEAILICYLLMIFGLNYFILQNKTLKDDQKVKNAFFLGLLVYGVFDSTCYAIFDNWSLKAVLMDTFWGAILFSATTLITLKLIK